MRIGAGVAVITIALSVGGCGFLHSPSLVPAGDPPLPTTASRAPDGPQSFDASPTDESDSPPAKETSSQAQSDKPKKTADSGSIQLLSPKWAKEAAPQKEEWEKRLDQTVNNVCRGC
jgi:hypothetical protein